MSVQGDSWITWQTEQSQKWTEAAREYYDETPTRQQVRAYQRRCHRLVVPLYGAVCAAWGWDGRNRTAPRGVPLPDYEAVLAGRESSPSLATCEKIPTSNSPENETPESADTPALRPADQQALTTAVAAEVAGGDPDALAEAVMAGTDAQEALHHVRGRSDRRQKLVVELIRSGEVPHAKRLAACGQQSVQLRCPDDRAAGGCGSKDNYLTMTCDSRLCPTCGKRRQGQALERYGDVLDEWRHPTMLRLSLPGRVDPDDVGRAAEALRGAFGRLRRRVIPPEGSHQGKRWVWDRDDGEPADHHWKAALLAAGRHDLARRWQKQYVRPAQHRVDDCPDCYTDRVRCEDYRTHGHDVEQCGDCWERKVRCDHYRRHPPKGIPVDELLRAGLYGVDAKQCEDGSVNVHLHVLTDCPYVPQAALSAAWDDLTAAPVVDVRRIEDRGEGDRIDALLETVGYAAKPPEYETVEAAVEYQKALGGSKLIQPFGAVHGNVPESEAALLCADCGETPAWWEYLGTVDEALDTMGTDWTDPTQGENDPPEGAA